MNLVEICETKFEEIGQIKSQDGDLIQEKAPFENKKKKKKVGKSNFRACKYSLPSDSLKIKDCNFSMTMTELSQSPKFKTKRDKLNLKIDCSRSRSSIIKEENPKSIASNQQNEDFSKNNLRMKNRNFTSPTQNFLAGQFELSKVKKKNETFSLMKNKLRSKTQKLEKKQLSSSLTSRFKKTGLNTDFMIYTERETEKVNITKILDNDRTKNNIVTKSQEISKIVKINKNPKTKIKIQHLKKIENGNVDLSLNKEEERSNKSEILNLTRKKNLSTLKKKKSKSRKKERKKTKLKKLIQGLTPRERINNSLYHSQELSNFGPRSKKNNKKREKVSHKNLQRRASKNRKNNLVKNKNSQLTKARLINKFNSDVKQQWNSQLSPKIKKEKSQKRKKIIHHRILGKTKSFQSKLTSPRENLGSFRKFYNKVSKFEELKKKKMRPKGKNVSPKDSSISVKHLTLNDNAKNLKE